MIEVVPPALASASHAERIIPEHVRAHLAAEIETAACALVGQPERLVCRIGAILRLAGVTAPDLLRPLALTRAEKLGFHRETYPSLRSWTSSVVEALHLLPERDVVRFLVLRLRNPLSCGEIGELAALAKRGDQLWDAAMRARIRGSAT